MNGYRPYAFLLLTLAWSWAFWWPIAMLDLDPWHGGGQVLLLVGGAGPMIMGLLFSALYSEGRGLKDLFRRLTDPRLARLRLWLVALGLVPGIKLLAMLGIGELSFALPEGRVSGFLAFFLFILVLGPLPEEIGWHGYALDALQTRHDPLAATAILAFCWGLWHVPLFAMTGYYGAFGEHPLAVWFFWNIAMTSVLMTWLYNHSKRSLMLMIAVHLSINLTGELVPHFPMVELVSTIVMSVIGGAIILTWLRAAHDGRDTG